MEHSSQNGAARPATRQKKRSGLVHRLVKAKDDPGKQRIRQWFGDISDEQLLSFGMAPDDIALLRACRR
jgi:hypothetical protein